MKRFFIVFSIIIVFKSCYTVMYTNEFVFRLKDEHNSEKTAKSIAEADGHCVYLGKVGNVPNFYRMYCRPRVRKRSILFQNETFLLNVQSKFEVSLLERQKLQYRVTRSQDPQWTNLWYLNGAVSPSMNVENAWNKGKTGKNIVVGVVDDGIYMTHPDIDANIDVANSYDYYAGDADANPSSSSFSHGTKVSGLIAAEADNNECTIGVAYNSTLIGIRLLGSTTTTDSKEASSLSHNTANIDIYVNSWGPNDGSGFEGPGTATLAALQNGVNTGRSGKGSIYVWAAGNGGTNDHCNGDGYASSRYVTTITAVTSSGTAASYDEVCSTVFAAVYSGDGTNNLISTIVPSGCASDLQGTSYSVPIAAGIIALTLEANPLLSWRDIQHLIVYTSNQHTLSDDYSTWQKNGAQKYVSQVLGFGLMDADAMVTEADSWINVPTQISCDGTTESSTISLETVSMDTESSISGCTIQYLETVSLDISLSYSRYRGLILLTLISPSGTESHILSRRPSDAASTLSSGSLTWTFNSIHFWGEEANGPWTLRYRKTTTSMTASITSWKLKLYGTASDPLQGINKCTPAPCKNNGTCIDRNYGYTCSCSSGYTGDTCDTNIVTPSGNGNMDTNTVLGTIIGASVGGIFLGGIVFRVLKCCCWFKKAKENITYPVPHDCSNDLDLCCNLPYGLKHLKEMQRNRDRFDSGIFDLIFDTDAICLKDKLLLSVKQAKAEAKISKSKPNTVNTLTKKIYDRFVTYFSDNCFPEYSLAICIPDMLKTYLLHTLETAINPQKKYCCLQQSMHRLSSLADDLYNEWEKKQKIEQKSQSAKLIEDMCARMRQKVCNFFSPNQHNTLCTVSSGKFFDSLLRLRMYLPKTFCYGKSPRKKNEHVESELPESKCENNELTESKSTTHSINVVDKQNADLDVDSLIKDFANEVNLEDRLKTKLKDTLKGYDTERQLKGLFELFDVIFEDTKLSLENQVSYSVKLVKNYHYVVFEKYKRLLPQQHMKEIVSYLLNRMWDNEVQKCMNTISTNFWGKHLLIKKMHDAMENILTDMVSETIKTVSEIKKTEEPYYSGYEIDRYLKEHIPNSFKETFTAAYLSKKWEERPLEISEEDMIGFYTDILKNFRTRYTNKMECLTPEFKANAEISHIV